MLIIVLIFVGIGAALIALAVQRRSLRLRSLARGLLVTYATIVLFGLAGEAYFRFAFAQSENVFTLANQNWLDRYWHTNALGYRDRDWQPADWQGKTTILLTGDSFTAGWGIENPADRFGDVLAVHLGADYAVFNLGVYGTNTPEQRGMLENHPVQDPDIVIMQYFLNDINYAMLSLGLLPQAAPTPDWARESYLANFLYTRVLGRWIDPAYNRDWWEDNYAAYDNALIWDVHRAELDAYIDAVQARDARLIVVLFPNMLDPVRSIPYVDRVAQVFEQRGYTEMLKLFDEAAAWSPQDRMVSSRDTHPSAAFHRAVGDRLYEQFFGELID
ncbi:MAG: SGNH/GDSL hydrolase family protein [bacterium]|nr:SGNH/GDSL hydrolase family protein [bacterium]